VNETLNFLARYGYEVLFLWVLAEQLGLPLPSAPLLLATGALAAAGRMNFAAATLIVFVAALAGDLFWYRLGLRHGTKFLGRLCRLSLEPDSCVRRSENFFSRHGLRSLLVAKFVPGLNAVAAPIAGAIRIPRWRFLLFDALGVLVWVMTFQVLGFVFARQLQQVANYVSHAGALVLGAAVSGAAAVYVTHKSAARRRFLAGLRMSRITVEELKRKLDTHEDVAIIDLRHPLDFLPQPYTLPGAIRIPAEELDRRQNEIPRDRDVALYCTCPNEASSANAVLKLRRYGITRVRPLDGGFHAWREREFPLDSEFGPVPPLKRRRASVRAAAS
jgi:membrane protein DedA with SNARE-associated domain/rhodanese-related sulfurtransferase